MSIRPDHPEDALSSLFEAFRLQASIFHNAQYCGQWAVDTSGAGMATFHMVTHGSCYVRSSCLSGAKQLGAGDMVIFPRDASHSVHPDDECDIEVNTSRSVSFEDGLRENGTGLLCGYFKLKHATANPVMAGLPPAIIWRADADSSGAARALSELIRAEALAMLPGRRAVLNRLAETLFVNLARDQLQDSLAGLAAALADKRIARVLDRIHDQPGKRWNLEDLAAIAAMSRSAFSELFKRLLGEPPMLYLAHWRMQQAGILLTEQGLPTVEVANRCGYETESSFSKAFKKATGISPGSLRREKPGSG
jgi:AraC-like DNA-binding protein